MTRSTRPGTATFRPVASTISPAASPVDKSDAIINTEARQYRGTPH